jgi:hypothetical protein
MRRSITACVVLAAVGQALAQRRARRRQNEYTHRLGPPLLDRARALPVDIQNHALAGLDLICNRLLRGAVGVAEHRGVLHELAVGDHAIKFFMRDIVIMHTVLFARTRRARGVRDREGDVRRAVDQRLGKRGLAGAGSSGEDKKFALIHLKTQIL